MGHPSPLRILLLVFSSIFVIFYVFSHLQVQRNSFQTSGGTTTWLYSYFKQNIQILVQNGEADTVARGFLVGVGKADITGYVT